MLSIKLFLVITGILVFARFVNMMIIISLVNCERNRNRLTFKHLYYIIRYIIASFFGMLDSGEPWQQPYHSVPSLSSGREGSVNYSSYSLYSRLGLMY
jgi:hypothetical protein